ncbi:MAG TPA: VWA domain-containing protein [Bryobacteraceae bacterium]|nr:VWA domain-containing protein [Bryobacteraceae bacterium]
MGRILLLGFLLTAVGAPESASSPRPLRVDSNLVLVSATVVDGSDRFVPDLRKTDFRLFDGGVLQQIATLSTEDVPVSAVIVFDASGSMKRSIPMAGLALREFLDTANPADEFSVVTVRARPELALPFVSRPEDVLDCLRGIKGAGRTALLDSVYMAAAYVRRGRHPRKVVLVISDGEDNHSRYTERELLDVLRETDVTLYSIGVDIQTPQYSPDGPAQPTGADILTGLAEATGGRYFEAWSPKELPGIMKKIDIRQQYVLGYSPAPLNSDGKYHRVELRLARQARERHLHAFCRPGYYAPLREGAR